MNNNGTNDQPLHEMKPLTRFTDRVADYVRFRPDYPEAALDAALEGLGFPGMLTVADIGAGTGILSWQLVTRGALVVAVEPNEDMRRAIEHHDRILLQPGTAEDTGLNDASVDLVICAQSFHWFDPAAALPELRRVLRGLGRLALFWNTRDPADPVTRGYAEAVRAASNDHPAQHMAVPIEVIGDSPHFAGVREFVFPHEQRLSADGLIGRARSASYCPREGPAFERLAGTLRDLHAAHRDASGLVSLRYRTRVILAEPAG
jgi:SAM-dependent methyltransferase